MPSDTRLVVDRDLADLGAGVYVGHDKHGRVWLYTFGDVGVNNSICLDMFTLAAFTQWVRDHRRRAT